MKRRTWAAIAIVVLLAILIPVGLVIADYVSYSKVIDGYDFHLEIAIYHEVDGWLYWQNNYAGESGGIYARTYLGNSSTETLAIENWAAMWQSVLIGDYIYAVGESEEASGWPANMSASIARISTDGDVDIVDIPDTADCNELIGVAHNTTHIVAGERYDGGLEGDSSWPDGGGLWLIPVASYDDPSTFDRVYEDSNNWAWTNIIYNSTDSNWYALISDSDNGAYYVNNSSNLTSWTTQVDGTGIALGYRVDGQLIDIGDRIMALVPGADEDVHLKVYDGAWTDYDLNIDLYGDTTYIKGWWNSSSSKVVMALTDVTADVHSIYEFDDDGTNIIETVDDYRGQVMVLTPSHYDDTGVDGIVHVPVSHTDSPPTHIHEYRWVGGSPPVPTPTATPSSDDWWNASFIYRQPLSITANATCGNLTDYQIEFNVSYEVGNSTNTTIYTSAHSQTDFDDIRFVYQEMGESPALVPYWIETVTSGVNATFWVNFSDVTNPATDGYWIYYGNDDVGNLSEILTTFPACDLNSTGHLHNFWHFEEAGYDGTPNEVIDETGDGPGTATNDATTTTAGLFLNASIFDGDTDYIQTAATNVSDNFPVIFEFWAKPVTAQIGGAYDTDPGTAHTCWIRKLGTEGYVSWNPSNPGFYLSGSSTANTWTHWIIVYTHSGGLNVITALANCSQVNQSAGSSQTSMAWNQFTIGCTNLGAEGDYYGMIDEFRVWYGAGADTDLIPFMLYACSGEYYMENMSTYYNFRKFSQCEPYAFMIDYGDGEEYLTLGCPSDLIITSVGGDEVTLNWTAGEYNQYYMVRMKAGSYPDNYSDGQEIYWGTSNYTADEGLSLDTTTYYYRVWGYYSGLWSDCYAENTVGGVPVLFGVVVGLTLAMTWFSSRRPEILLRLVASIMWLALMFWIILGSTGFELADVWTGLIATACGVMAFVPWYWQMQTAIIRTRGNKSWTEFGAPPIIAPNRQREHARKLNRITQARRRKRWLY